MKNKANISFKRVKSRLNSIDMNRINQIEICFLLYLQKKLFS